MMKILIGAIIQESNTFSPVKSTMDDFRRHHFQLGKDMLGNSIENEIKGFLDAAKEEHVQIIPTFSANAISSGVFTSQAFEELKSLLSQKIQDAEHEQYDGIYFAMHGAMVAEGYDDLEGELIETIRQCAGYNIPLVISLDLHANVTQKMIDGVDGLVGFRTFPHVDFVTTGYRSAKLLFSIIRGEIKPKLELRKIPMIVPAENSQSFHGPFFELWQEAAVGENEGMSLTTSLFPVQPWLDIDNMGSSVVVMSDDRAKAKTEADRLASLFWQKRHDFSVHLYSIEEIVQHTLNKRKTGNLEPVIVSDSADSPSAGATGDSNFVLKQLIASGAHERLTCVLMIVDPGAVAKVIEAGEGQTISCDVGYTLNINTSYGSPLRIKGKVRNIGNGSFILQGGYAKNTKANLGRYAVVDVGKISLLISELPTFSSDPGMYQAVGLDPSIADIVMVKSANQFRRDYEHISKDIYILNTPGCSPSNVKLLEYKKILHPFYPFEDHFDWSES